MNKFSKYSALCSGRGISIVEMVLTVSIIAAIATISALAVSGINRTTQHQKLTSEVQTLNSAIQTYVANGGDLSGLTDPNEILTKLKTTLSKEDKERHVGAPSGKMVDSRVRAIAVEEDSWRLRATYDAGARRFVASETGDGFEFILDAAMNEIAPSIETRDSTMSYAQNSSWVWDHASTNNPNAPSGPSTFNTNPNVGDSVPTSPVPPTPDPDPDPDPGNGGGQDPAPTPDPPSDPPPPTPPKLATPYFSKASGSHPESDFPLSVTITNVPSAADADPIYQIDGGPWNPYTGAVSVEMNKSLRAQFLSKDSSVYRDSSQRSAYYYPVAESLSGTANGAFHSPTGGPNLKYQISSGDNRFSHGDSIYVLDGEPVDSGDPNVLELIALDFSDVAPGEKFKLATLYYHNGNSYYDSHATGVKNEILINLTERGEVITVNLNFDLVNTENDPDDPSGSADYVRLTNLQQNIPLQINGVQYRVKLEFGATDSFGFSSESQFHVYEGATGTGEILATFLTN